MVKKTFTVTVTVPAGQAANSRLPAKITFDPVRGAQDYYQAPTFGGLAILKVFVQGTPAIDGVLIFKINGQEVYWTHPIKALDISNPRAPIELDPPILLDGGDKLEVDFINYDPGDATNPTTLTIYLEVDEETG